MDVRRTAMIAGLLGLAAVTAGCGIGGPENTETASYDVTGTVTALDVGADGGAIEVIESDRQGVHVTETLTWTGDRPPQPTHEVKGGTLVLAYTCPTGWGGMLHCDVGYKVEIPRGLRVKAGTDSGAVTLRGLSGEVETNSDSGRIEATDLTGKQVVAGTDSGGISLSFAAAPDKVETNSDSGSSVVRVPEGPYDITATTDSGRRRVDAAHDGAAPRKITLRSDSGALEVLPAR
ncbi:MULTISPECIES: DUF4097 family beta strand repeat-containing protein [Nonomuraea]|uniref:DUF4097 family beta strand repeat-containing protein n=1 Tax=Nonomuraea ferruginea TaxID=46174 RepID=A0ABT4TAW4_9ACTN|nr:DUF4097 family beta strand repeat-containing protein [Nonomuraea ferruginea]MDA0646658.1 DUF4097 family beta strand repeat-containing protein [Nonomuraea ferruginea]